MGRTQRICLAVDVLLVLVFVVIGRVSHDEGLGPLAFARTAWPFLVGLALGTMVAMWARQSPYGVPAGASVWLGTVVVGLLLRWVSGQGTAMPFVIVAAVVLGVLLIGPRLLVRGMRRRLLGFTRS